MLELNDSQQKVYDSIMSNWQDGYPFTLEAARSFGKTLLAETLLENNKNCASLFYLSPYEHQLDCIKNKFSYVKTIGLHFNTRHLPSRSIVKDILGVQDSTVVIFDDVDGPIHYSLLGLLKELTTYTCRILISGTDLRCTYPFKPDAKLRFDPENQIVVS